MKKILLIIAVLAIIGGLYYANTKGTKDSTGQNDTQALSTPVVSGENLSSTTVETYKLADVAKHNKPGDCWTTVAGKVYDLTTWPEKHPGGDKAIFAICGIDGTKAFEKAHAGQDKPANVLDSFLIGSLI